MAIRVCGNRPIKTLAGQETRPTAARVREALFNIWQGSIAECHWLDICAGVGSMGAEALGRGAATVIGLEKSPRACAVIQANWSAIARPPQAFRVHRGEALASLTHLRGQVFDRIYFDPPYASDLYGPVLAAIDRGHFLAEGGELAVECAAKGAPEHLAAIVPPGLNLIRLKTYGSTSLGFFKPKIGSQPASS